MIISGFLFGAIVFQLATSSVSSFAPLSTEGPTVAHRFLLPHFPSRRTRSDYYDGYYDDGDAENYWSNPPQKEQKENRGGMYKVYFGNDIDPKETQLDWEVCSDGESEALVLLPPEAVDRPTAILHFVGGTFFGSAPKLWYRTFLEGLVRNTQCAVVITPIPVTLLKSPLQHVALSQSLRKALENAWSAVLEDEYGDLKDIPLCGVGHSLGSRLLVVSSTMNQNRPEGSLPPYKSFVLISFTNFGASAGIPGVSSLSRQSKKQEQVAVVTGERQRRKFFQKVRQDWWIDHEDDDYHEEEDWQELLEEIQELISEQANRVKNALTPKSKDLEFYPTPDKLWKALREDARYSVPETLLVQFEDDVVDQSAKLARILKDTNSSDVKFARLRGTHLTPVSIDEGDAGGLFELTTKASKALWKAIRGRSKTKIQSAAMRDLRQSVARYITDVVTK